jgi:serine/threonine-protein kinase
MELVEGHSLGDWLYHLGKLSVGDAVHVALAVARALHHAHQNGLVHRDVKPDNILITHDGQVKLADLGLAKAVLDDDLSATQTGHGAGTPVYMAPEQARSARQADPRSDLYAVGCVLFHMLTGQFPFRAASSVEVILAKLEGVIPSARALNSDVPPALEAVLALLLAADPDARYQSATDLANELDELELGHQTLHFLGAHGRPAHATPADRSASLPTDLTTLAEEKPWYVLYRTAEGRWVTRKLTTARILRALADEHFALTAQAGRSRGEYRFLAELPEFRQAVVARKAEIAAGGKAVPPERRASRPRRRPHWLVRVFLFLAVAAAGFWLGHILFS